MALCTVQNVYDAARSHAGDTAVAGGQLYTNTYLQPFYVAAANEFYRVLQMDQSPRDRRTVYSDLPPYTSVLPPALLDIPDLGEIESVSETGGVTEIAISTASAGPSVFSVTTTTPHGLSSGQQMTMFGIGGFTDNVNGMFAPTVTGATTFYLSGLVAVGTYGGGGTVTALTQQFTPVDPVQRAADLAPTPQGPQTILRQYAFENNLFWFPSCSALRQVRITYLRSGNPPISTTATISVDDCLDYLAMRTAGLALRSSGNTPKGATLTVAAVGAKWESDYIAGGLLAQFISNDVRDFQRLPPSQRRAPPWRVHPRRRGRIW